MATLVLLSVLAVAGCGGGGNSEATIALLLPTTQLPRYEAVDRPTFEGKVEEICPECRIIYRNAGGDLFEQKKQVNEVLKQEPDVLVFDPQDPTFAAVVEKVKAAGVPVLDYDRLIINARSDAYVSYDRIEVGRTMAEMLAQRLAEEGKARGPVVFLNGETGANEQPRYEQGAREGFAGRGVEIARQYDTSFSSPRLAREEMSQAIAALGRNGFAGVYAETDGIARGAIAAMRAAGIDPAGKPTVGRGATVAGRRQVVRGQQYVTIAEPARPAAVLAAEAAVELAAGDDLQGKFTDELENGSTKVSSILLEPVALTKADVKAKAIAARH